MIVAWICLCAFLNCVGWLLSALHLLNRTGYFVAIGFAMLAWIVQNRELHAWATLVVGGFALANAVIGSWLVWRLLRDPPAGPKSKD
jgi:phage-related protein